MKHPIKWIFAGLLAWLILLPGQPAQAASSTHRLTWLSGSAPTSISLDKQTMTSTPSVNLQTEHVLNLNFSFTGNADVGQASIKIPAQIFLDRDGNGIGQVTVPLLEAPAVPTTGNRFNYELVDEINPSTGKIETMVVIRNTEPINGNFFLTIDIKYQVMPYQVEMSHDVANNRYAYVRNFDAWLDVNTLEGQRESYQSNAVTMDYRTKVNLDGLSKSVYSASINWPSVLGAPPADAGDYFYVSWSISPNALSNDTMPFDLYVREINPLGDEYGEMIGFSDSYTSGIRRGSLADFVSYFSPYKTTVDNPATSGALNRTYWNPYVYFRYPKSILENNQAVVKNLVEAETLGYDGMSSLRTAQATYTFVMPTPAPTPQPGQVPTDVVNIRKRNTGTSYGLINRIEDNRKAPFKLVRISPASNQVYGNFYFDWLTSQSWHKSWDGQEFGKQDYTNEFTDNRLGYYGGTPYVFNVLGDGDYQLTSLRFNGYIEYGPSISQTSNGYSYNTAAKPYAQYRPVVIWVEKNGQWSELGSILRTGISSYTYTPLGGTAQSGGSTWDIALPAGSTGVRFRHTTNSVYVSYSSIYLEFELLRSQRVLDMIKGLNSLTLYNSGTLTSYGSEKSNTQSASATHQLTRSLPQSVTSKTVGKPVEDVENLRYAVDYTVTAYDYVTNPGDMSLEQMISEQTLTEQRQSTFYDLLPPGTNADLGSIKVSGYGLSPDIPFSHRLELHDNWKGSGRTMLIVHAQVPEGVSNYSQINYGSYRHLRSGMVLTFKLYNTWLNVVDNGTTLINYAAYESHDGSLGAGQPDIPNMSYPSSVLRNAMTDLNLDGNPADRPKNFLYSSVSLTYTPLRAFETGFVKHVASPEDPAFSEHTEVLAGGRYTYRLRLQNIALKLKDLVFYDVLETAYGSNDHWQGSLVGVDISHALSRGIAAKVYYATSPISDADILNEPDRLHLDRNLNTIWSLTPPQDLSTVTAVAIDLRQTSSGREFILDAGQSVLVNINMQAPVENIDQNLPNLAYNRGILANRKSDITGTEFDDVISIESCNPVTVGLREVGMVLDKTATPQSGTATDPAVVYGADTLTYHISLKNNNIAQAITQIKLEDVIPEGLVIDAVNIELMLDDNLTTRRKIQDSTRAGVSVDGQKLNFHIISLAAQEKMTFIIPTSVGRILTGEEAVYFENQARVSETFGKPYIIESPITYHEQPFTSLPLSGQKTLIGREMQDTDLFTFVLEDEAGTLLKQTSNTPPDTAFAFDLLYLDRPGTFHYRIREVKGGLDSVLYDQRSIEMEITVVADAQGALSAMASFTRDGEVLSADALGFTNEFVSTSLEINKHWTLPTDKELVMPDELPTIVVTLFRDGLPYDQWRMWDWTPEDNTDLIWSHVFENLPKLRPDGTEYVYTAREIVPPPHFQNSQPDANNIINVYRPGIFTAYKSWSGLPGEIVPGVDVSFQLYQTILNDPYTPAYREPWGAPVVLDGKDFVSADQEGEIEAFLYQWLGLPANALVTREINGELISEYVSFQYEVEETSVPEGYLLDAVSSSSRRISNVRDQTIFTAYKTWENGEALPRPDVQLQLTWDPDGDGIKEDYPLGPVTLPSGQLSYTWTELPRFRVWDANDLSLRSEYVYGFRELPLQDYQATYSEDGLGVRNSYIIPKTQVVASKTWVGGPSSDHSPVFINLFRQSAVMTEPEHVYLRNGNFIQSGEAPTFVYTWTNLDETDLQGNAYTYFVQEAGVDENGIVLVGPNRYLLSQEGNDITNTYQIPTTSVYATKTWVDGPVEDHQPVQLLLYRQAEGWQTPQLVDVQPEIIPPPKPGEPVPSPEVPPHPGKYLYAWHDIEQTTMEGLEYQFHVIEQDAIDGSYEINGFFYLVSNEGDMNIINTFQVPLIDITASKTWVGGPSSDHQAIELTLLQDGFAMDPQPVPEITGESPLFHYAWRKLPKTDQAGVSYQYSVEETGLQDGMMQLGPHAYLLSQDGFNLTNTYLPPAPAQLELSLQKALEHAALQEGAFSFLVLDADGQELARAVNDANGLVSFEHLYFEEEAQELVLQVVELAGADPYIRYDATSYLVYVQVQLVEGNQLEATIIKVEKNGQEQATGLELVFTNTYVAPEPSPAPTYPTIRIPIHLRKELKNGTLQANQFQFELRDASGKVLATAFNDADGLVTFPDRTFSRVVSRYLYTIHEVAGNDSNISYDSTVYTLLVSTSAEDGKLTAQVDIKKNDTPFAGDMLFSNIKEMPQTGDPLSRLILALGLIAFSLGLASIWLAKRKRRKS